jgi:Family of unknown function (DUF5372)
MCRESGSRNNPVLDQQEFGRLDQRAAAFPLQEGKRRCYWLAPAKRRVAGIGGVIPRPEESLPRAPVPALPLPWAPGPLCPSLNVYATGDSRQNNCAEFDATISRSTRSRGPGTRVGSSPPAVPQKDWHECSTTPQGDVEIRRFRVTHPYHPLFRQEFELVSYRQDWGEDRVWFQDQLGRLHSLPTSWTDAGAVDPFVALAAGRSLFRVADLIELARQIDGGKSQRVERTVKENMS